MNRPYDPRRPAIAAIPASAAQWLVKVLVEDGIAGADVLDGTGLTSEWLTKPDATLDVRQYEQLVRKSLTLSGDPALGISVSRQLNFLNRHGFWGYAVLSCTTLGEALDTAVRFWPLTGSLMRVSRVDAPRSTAVLGSPAFDFVTGDVWRFAMEKFLFSTVLSLGWMSERTAAFEAVHLSYAAPPHAERYEKALACPVRFNTDADRVFLCHGALEWPLMTRQPELAQMCRERFRVAMLRLQGNDPLVAAVQQFVWAHIQNAPTLAAVASHLGTNPRTLRRRLHERHSSFQRILDGVRETIARDYLLNTALSIDQIASLVGFSEPTTFRSTFKRWTGHSATEIRRMHPAPPASSS